MSRIKLTLPKEFIFDTFINVRIDDINYGGHLSNDAVLSLIHEARVRFFQHYNYTEFNVESVSLIMADTAIVYKSESFQGDQLQAFVTPDNFSRAGFDLYYRLFRPSDQQEIAHAKTGMICYDYEEERVVGVPPALKDKFQ